MPKGGFLIAAVALVACTKTETAKTDSAAAAAAAPPPPAAITAADLVGTYTGQTMLETSDSVVARWICVQPPTGNEGYCVDNAAPKDTMRLTYTITGDSVMWTSKPYKPPMPPKSPEVIDHIVGRMSGGKWSGTSVSVLASKPDSVVMRTRWEATKSP
jgi:hypothetical protein